MARRRYYRVRRVYPKQKWLPVNNEVRLANLTGLNAASYITTIQPITENPTRNASDGGGNVSSATIVKVGRIKVKGSLTGSATQMSYIIGVAYIPEGYVIDQTASAIGNLGTTFFYRHPEWIMCWTRMDFVNGGQNNEFSMTSRLKRNLNSGDQIVLFRIGINATNDSVNVSSIGGTITYVCRTN